MLFSLEHLVHGSNVANLTMVIVMCSYVGTYNYYYHHIKET
jgi:hypothetical protein